MRELKFRAWDKQEMYMTDSMSFDQLMIREAMNKEQVENMELMQYTGLKDKNGVEVYEGDLVNVFYTSGDSEYNHDCIYKVSIDPLYGLTLTFVNLLWASQGHNQYPTSTTLSSEYGGLSYDNINQNYDKIAVTESYHENHIRGDRWKGRDYSNYIEVIGNIYQNPELLEKNHD